MDPAEIMDKYGADLLRLWAASADYHADVRCSDNIFKQLSQNYLKFRNTCKFILDNLVDFDPENLTPASEMAELDRWVLTQTNRLMEKAAEAYNNYEFHIIAHAVNDFCVTTLSSFYLDIVKDRLYCDEADSASRRSAQSALYLVLDTLAKLFAPILCFTCDEIWLAMPHRKGDDARNILFNEMNKPFAEYDLGDCVSWASLIQLRTGVNAALEAARAEKKIGKALEAQVNLKATDEAAAEALKLVEGLDLAELFIVSAVTSGEAEGEALAQGTGTNFPGMTMEVFAAPGEKCPRCWMHSTKADENGLCPRCSAVMANFVFED